MKNSFLTVLTDEDVEREMEFTRGTSCPAALLGVQDERTTVTSPEDVGKRRLSVRIPCIAMSFGGR